ncbi:long-chain fatty acid--CoA ligase [Flexivirga caeni]|uniref:Long-chain fatty acid--CoA ligase n=2 Tax=Flexivirga caeni TaxID=2294115 RepID=A0A3M9MKT1_9MICO|nr:long-chain fatty acid--CoA ligase [Flexivirga caeni]RNI25493.1 long-chain fatty acid--CoA ligase [Flexivirga caeni]
MTNLAERLDSSASADPDSVAVKLDDCTLSYGKLADAAHRLARLLTDKGLKPGDMVGIMLPNVPEWPICYYGVLLAGGVVVPMNPLLKEQEVEHYISDSGARILLAWHEAPGQPATGAKDARAELISVEPVAFAQTLAGVLPLPLVERDESDLAVILYTSGTTGRPKGAELTHANMRKNADLFSQEFLKLTPGDVVMGCLPFFHTFGQTNSLNSAIFAGATLTLIARFDGAKALDVIERDKVTAFIGVPTMYAAMLAAGREKDTDTSSLRLCCSGGAAMPVELLRGFEERFGCVIIEGYGLSETSPVASFNPPDGVRKIGSIGLPVTGVEMRAVDDDGKEVPQGEPGEIAIRGHNVMKGYHNLPEATAEVLSPDGWFLTGDVATVDEDGYFFIVDRKKSLIIRGGYNVYPREIEEVIYAHPDVFQAAVIGIPDDNLGEEVGAAVELNAGASVTEEELRAFVRDRVAAYKYPRKIWFVEELPKGPTGKILRREVTYPGGDV